MTVAVAIKRQYIAKGRIELEFDQSLHGRSDEFETHPKLYEPDNSDSPLLEDILERLAQKEKGVCRVKVGSHTLVILFKPHTPAVGTILRCINEIVDLHNKPGANFSNE